MIPDWDISIIQTEEVSPETHLAPQTILLQVLPEDPCPPIILTCLSIIRSSPRIQHLRQTGEFCKVRHRPPSSCHPGKVYFCKPKPYKEGCSPAASPRSNYMNKP